MKKLSSLIVLVQVGSHLYLNPTQVVGVLDNRPDTECPTVILTPGGSSNGNSSAECSDWKLDKVLDALTKNLINWKKPE